MNGNASVLRQKNGTTGKDEMKPSSSKNQTRNQQLGKPRKKFLFTLLFVSTSIVFSHK